MATFIAIFQAILQAIPILNRWFTKTATEKIEDEKQELRNEMDEFRKTGRPQ